MLSCVCCSVFICGVALIGTTWCGCHMSHVLSKRKTKAFGIEPLPSTSLQIISVKNSFGKFARVVLLLVLILVRGTSTAATSNPRERYYHRQIAIHASKYKHFI
jgi:hypothetical protein